MNWTIMKKLIGGFLLVLILLVSISAIAVTKMTGMGSKVDEINSTWFPASLLVHDIKIDFINIDRLSLRLTLESNPEEKEQLVTRIQDSLEKLKKEQEQYEKDFLTDPEEKKLYGSLKEKEVVYFNTLSTLIQAAKENKFGEVNSIIKSSRPSFDEANQKLEELADVNSKGADLATDIAANLYHSGKTLVITLSTCAVILGVIISILISRMISTPIKQIAIQLRRIAEGDLTGERIVVKTKDEIKDLADDFNKMSDRLRVIVYKVSQNAEQVSAMTEEMSANIEHASKATEQISLAMQEVSSGSDKQVATVVQSTKVVEENSKGMEQAVCSIQTVADCSSMATEQALQGNEVVSDTTKQMNVVQEKVQTTATVIESLGQKSNEIGNIIELITQIASQTNLLALNAAIEAARAGEHGKGFSVVADEVRKLAEESNHSAESIQALICDIQDESHRAIQAMQEGLTAVQEGLTLVDQTGEAFRGISNSIEKVSTYSQQVTSVIKQVNTSSQTMVQMMDDIAQISETSAESTQNIAASVEEQNASIEEIVSASTVLAKTAEELRDAIHIFKV